MAFQLQLASMLGNNTKHLGELQQNIIRPLLQLAVKAFEEEYIEEGALDFIGKNFDVPQSHIDEWYAAILTILRLHFRAPNGSIKAAEFKQCLQELKFQPECIQDIVSVVTGPKRPILLSSLTNRVQFYPHLVSCKWRIDITISSSSISRVLEPNILMEWILSNGECHTFELSLARFHQLRYTIAKLLLEVETLENHNRLKNK